MNLIPFDQPATYRILVLGHLAQKWSSYFDGMTIQWQDQTGEKLTELFGELPDQSALQGVLQKLYNLGFALVSAERIEARGK